MLKISCWKLGIGPRASGILGLTLALAGTAAAQQSVPPAIAPRTPATVFARLAADQNGNIIYAQERITTEPSPTPAPAAEAAAERVIVTGSNIPTAQEVGPNPVDSYSRDIITKSGERTSEEFLRNLPIANANGVPPSNNENGSNTAVGAATIALRGFDSRATLILIDGRRVAPYPMGNNGGTVNAMFVDLNSIPQAAIESIEILKDGASTTYGADAVAGVVNIKLRHDYDGTEASIEYGNTFDKDSGEFAASLIFGTGNKDTNVTGVLNFYHRNSIANRDRDYSAVPPFLSTNASPYNLQLTNAAVAAAGGTVVPTTSGNQFGHAPFGTNGTAPASTYTYSAGRSNTFNYNQFSLSFPEQERYGGYFSADHKIFSDQMVIYADMFYQNVQTHNELAPPATGPFQSKGQTILAIPPRTANPAGTTPFGGPTYAETGVTPGAFNPFNPFEQIISGGTKARLAEFGNRIFDNETDALLGSVGLRGDKLFDGTWGYDAAFRYSQLKNVQVGKQVSATAFNRILNQADPIFNPASPQYIGTTVAFNPFGDYHVPIAANQATVDFATVHPKDEDISKLATLDATMYTTSLFDLPAGGVGLAFGAQFRREDLSEDPDKLNVMGDVVGNSPVPAVRGGRKSYAFYGESRMPIFSPDNAVTGFRSLEFTAAARFEAFENNDTNVLVPKFGMRWQPLDEQLTIRATWGEGFREPSLEELFSAPVSVLTLSHDPQNGGLVESETNTLIVSNPHLQPEDSRSFSGGFVYTPKYLPGLNFSIDLWDIERTGVVAAPTADQVLAREASGTLLPGEVVERDGGGFITRIIIPDQNLGAQTARGADFGLQYQRQTPFGTFTSVTQATHLYEFFFPQFARGNLAGRTTNDGASDEGYYRWKGEERLDWNWYGFDLLTTVRYTDGFHEQRPNLDGHYVKQTFRFDLLLTYDFTALVRVEDRPVAGYSKESKDVQRGKGGAISESAAAQTSNFRYSWQQFMRGTSVSIGVNNVFDQDPPKAFGEGGNAVGYPGFTYDATGRFLYARLVKKF